METKTKVEIGIGAFIVLAVSGVLFLVNPPEGYDFFECDDLEGGMYCWKLSAVNSDGLQTSCYWNISAPRRNKRCTTGWYLSSRTEIEGKEIMLKDFADEITTTAKFANEIEARDYLYELMVDTKTEYGIIDMEKKLDGKEITVYWRARIFKESSYQETECDEEFECVEVTKTQRAYIVDEVLSSTVPEEFCVLNEQNQSVCTPISDEEINEIIHQHATTFIANWEPDIRIKVE